MKFLDFAIELSRISFGHCPFRGENWSCNGPLLLLRRVLRLAWPLVIVKTVIWQIWILEERGEDSMGPYLDLPILNWLWLLFPHRQRVTGKPVCQVAEELEKRLHATSKWEIVLSPGSFSGCFEINHCCQELLKPTLVTYFNQVTWYLATPCWMSGHGNISIDRVRWVF